MRLGYEVVKVAAVGMLVLASFSSIGCNFPQDLIDAVVSSVVNAAVSQVQSQVGDTSNLTNQLQTYLNDQASQFSAAGTTTSN